jgi:hypothetical protein
VIWRPADAGDEQRRDWERPKPRGEYMLHADTHYPTFKAWFYLNDITERNGAFVYVRGSHRLSLERLKYEYDASIRVAKAKRDGIWRQLLYGHSCGIRDDFLTRLGLREQAIRGPANTLVANTTGFHCRGAFSCEEPRETVHLDWRSLGSWASFLLS